jgi:transcriptional regulator
MYIRPIHAELNVPALHSFIRENPLGLFTTAIKHPTIATIQTTHIPWVLDTDDSIDWSDADADAAANADPAQRPTGSLGVLRGHIARANPQTKVMIDASSHTPSTSGQPIAELSEEVLILFNSPYHSYVSPRYYKETKPDTGKVVPTWNYSAVQVYGRCRIHHSGPQAASFLQKQVNDLTNHNEPRSGGSWKVGDAPERYVELLKKGIIGIEITIERIEGRFKMSQESNGGDWTGVRDGFKEMGGELGEAMSARVVEEGKKRDDRAKQARGL